MAYIPEEHKQYPVLPYSRENGGEVFQYYSWPDHKLMELIGDHLIPYGYKSYEEYLGKIDCYLQQYADNQEVVGILKKMPGEHHQMEQKRGVVYLQVSGR